MRFSRAKRPLLQGVYGIGTLFTLFVVPAMYMVLAAEHTLQAAEATLPAKDDTEASHWRPLPEEREELRE